MVEYENIIEKYLQGRIEKDEAQRLGNWLNQDSKHQEFFEEYKNKWSPYSYQDEEIDRMLNIVRKKVFDKNRFIHSWSKIAAYAAVLTISFILGYQFHIDKPAETTVDYTSVITANGEKSKVILPDSSVVYLNSGSRLDYATDFTRERHVNLQGEAFFDVTTNKEKKFTVQTTNYKVEVLGTQFNVASYTGELSKTTLIEGRINVLYKDSLLSMTPGDQAILSDNKIEVVKVNADEASAWHKNHFVFNSVSFFELIKRLERWYDVRIDIEGDGLNNSTYSGRFKNHETIWQVLDVLAVSEGISYQRLDNRYLMIKKNE